MTVSIIIPIHNGVDFVRRSLASAEQAGSAVGQNYEILLVDDASTDGSVAAAQRYIRQSGATISILTSPRRGAPAARNYGVEHSSGRWLQFLDVDDTLAPDKIAHQLQLAGADQQWVVGAYHNLYVDGSTKEEQPHDDLWRGLFFQFRTGHTISNLVRRDALVKIGGWNEALANNQDPDLAFRLLRAAVPYVLDRDAKSFYHHHPSPSRITSSDAAGRLQNRMLLLVEASVFLQNARPTYWQENKSYLLGALLRTIRLAATYDLEAATRHYATLFGPQGPYDHSADLELLSRYTRLYPYLGFKNLERLRLALAGIFPPALKRLAKR